MSRFYRRGRQVTLVQAFREFMEMVESASVTFKEGDVNEQGEETGEIRYNLFLTNKKFKSSLRQVFGNILSELTDEITDRYEKLEKLNFVTRHIVETQALLQLFTKSQAGVSHQNFVFENLTETGGLRSQKFTEADVQPQLQAGLTMTEKLLNYLVSLKSNIELIRQDEFGLPVHMQADSNASTLENPLLYFEYLISKNGVIHLLRDFIPSDDELDNTDVNYNKETETKTYWEPDEEGWASRDYKFIDTLRSVLYREFYRSRDLMDQAISRCQAKKQVKLMLAIWVDKLLYLKHSAEKETSIRKYDVIPRSVEAVIRYLFEKYRSFCPKPNKNTEVILEKSTYYELPPAPSGPILPALNEPPAFLWTADAEKNTMALHSFLNQRFIADMEMTEFHKAFSGAILPADFSIRWIDRTPNDKHVNKKTLLYLFQQLIMAGLINENFGSPGMIFKLTRYFKNDKGGRFENMGQSMSGLSKAKKKTEAFKEIDEFVKKLTA